MRAFPEGFRWGAATAAFQIEGATGADGRTDSIWDVFSRKPGAVLNGDTGDPACDHYNRMPEDVDLLAGLGLDTYRFSVAWPRVRPDAGARNAKGIEFYSRLVDSLLDKGIRPWVTLYHWDLPQTLQDAGGWANRDTAHRFAEYALTVHEALGDRVDTWTTLNEPWCSAFLGYASGDHAPGRTDPHAAVAAVHHLLLAHGLGLQALREAGVAEAGITVNLQPFEPAHPDRRADVDLVRRLDGLQNRLFLDPLLLGSYPTDVVRDLEPFGLADHVRDGDLELIGAPIDVLGINYYTSAQVTAEEAHSDADRLAWAVGAPVARVVRRDLATTAMGWEITPDAFRDLLIRVKDDYPPVPIVITENGSAWDDEVSGGSVDDPQRVEYLCSHLQAVHEAIEAGVDARGYLAWSLLDNFEWAWGYSKRFGVVYVDYETQQRIPKRSAKVLADIARRNAL
ncbi:MAG TPA: GH1 family beta-glucosidase [Actinomycetales bacterium]|nr:GH1 family beta-glucosidase [Actinomycetales bacterium]